MLTLSPGVQRSQNGVTVAGGNGRGDDTNQINGPFGLDIDDDNQNLVIADFWNRSIVEWKMGGKNSKSDCWLTRERKSIRSIVLSN